MNTKKLLKKLHCSLSRIMNRIRILLYGNLRVNKGLRCWFKLSGHSNIKKMLKFANFIEILYFA